MSYNRRTLSPDSPCAIAAALLFFAAAALRIVGFILSYTGELLAFDLICELIIPAACSVIFGAMLISRKKSLIPTVIPLLCGSLYFIFRSLGLELWLTVVLLGVYAIFALVYILTVTGILNTRGVLMFLCALACAIYIFFLNKTASPVSSIIPGILTLTAIFLESVGMRRGRLY